MTNIFLCLIWTQNPDLRGLLFIGSPSSFLSHEAAYSSSSQPVTTSSRQARPHLSGLFPVYLLPHHTGHSLHSVGWCCCVVERCDDIDIYHTCIIIVKNFIISFHLVYNKEIFIEFSSVNIQGFVTRVPVISVLWWKQSLINKALFCWVTVWPVCHLFPASVTSHVTILSSVLLKILWYTCCCCCGYCVASID